MGWTGTKNGELLRLDEQEFDVFITADQNLSYQQNLRSHKLQIFVFVAPNNRLDTLLLLVPQVISQLATIKPGEVVRIYLPT
jgi:hypothetical protein